MGAYRARIGVHGALAPSSPVAHGMLFGSICSLLWTDGGAPGRTAGKACIRGGMLRSISRCSGSSRSVWIIGGLVRALALIHLTYVRAFRCVQLLPSHYVVLTFSNLITLFCLFTCHLHLASFALLSLPLSPLPRPHYKSQHPTNPAPKRRTTHQSTHSRTISPTCFIRRCISRARLWGLMIGCGRCVFPCLSLYFLSSSFRK